MTEQQKLREAVARAMVAKDSGPEGSILFELHWREFGEGYLASADAAIAVALEEAARVAEGPPYRTSGTTGEVSIRGGDDGNWSVPMPLAGYKGSDYGTGRYDAAAAIRALIPSESETGERD